MSNDLLYGLFIAPESPVMNEWNEHILNVLNHQQCVCRSLMEKKLRSGTFLIVDCYSYSGVAFSSTKGLDIEWCKVVEYCDLFVRAPEMGLLAPDLVLFLDIPPEVSPKTSS
ncbi:unnamed protein product [Ilex paraguariensis]|uniref:Thymidylate kinase-like domain-containing protein n=1 Tax=Ilex paraguariensis TaxID=185542 RepID=A0ABC8R6L0_9AQUA